MRLRRTLTAANSAATYSALMRMSAVTTRLATRTMRGPVLSTPGRVCLKTAELETGIRPIRSVFYGAEANHMDRNSDRRLITRLQAGDDTAVHELAERYGPRIFQLALRQMKNREDAEEVTQDVLVKVYRKIDAFRGDAALSSWIYRITFNTAMSRLRGNRAARAAEQERDRSLTALGDGEERRAPRQTIDSSPLPDEELLRTQLREAVSE